MQRRRRATWAASGACAALAGALVFAGCGTSASSHVVGPASTGKATTTTAPLTATTGHTAAGPATTAAPRVTPSVAAALQQQLSAVTGELSVANSAIAQSDVDAAKTQEGNQP